MDLNPLFISSTSFRPSAHAAGGGLDLFAKAKIDLVHGWLVEPDSEEGKVVMKVGDYDRAVEFIAEVDHLTGGKLVLDEETLLGSDDVSSSGRPETGSTHYSDEQKKKIEDGKDVGSPRLDGSFTDSNYKRLSSGDSLDLRLHN